jgi:hypothetical protein
MAALLAVELFLVWLIVRTLASQRSSFFYEGLVGAFVISSAVLCLLAEGLGLIGAFRPSVLLILHASITVALVAVCFKRRAAICATFRQGRFDSAKSELAPIWCLALAALLSLPPLFGAVFAPPSNWDSMTYHLPKAMHWLSQGSLAHYPTYSVRQIVLNPAHEILMAHGIGLGGSDRYAGVLNTVAFFIAMLAAAGVVRRVGGGALAQCFAVVFMATVPMGILQASTTQNDLLLGTYLISVLLGMLMVRQSRSLLSEITMWCAIGLAILTKGLSLLWVPSIALVAFPYRRFLSSVRGVAACALGVVLVLILNLGYFSRNYESFGNFLGPKDGPFKMSDFSVQGKSSRVFLSNVARTVALHSNTPIYDSAPWINEQVSRLHGALGVDLSDPNTTLPGTTFGMLDPKRIHEDLAGNGGHLALSVLVLVAVVTLAVLKRRGWFESSLAILATFIGFLLLCFMVRWQPWASRLQLPLFMLAVPSCAALVARPLRGALGLACVVILVYAAWPYWFRNELRPLVGESSIISGEDLAERFYPQPFLYPEFKKIAKRIRKSGCYKIGTVRQEDDWEQGLYAFFGLKLSVVSCDVPKEYGRYLWLEQRREVDQIPCAIVWFGGNAPNQVTACGREYHLVGKPGYLSYMVAG